MNPHIRAFKKFLTDNPINYAHSDASSLLEMLYLSYTMDNPIDSEAIRSHFNHLENILSKLSLADNNQVFAITADLCLKYERQAFLEGLLVGAHLYMELAAAECSFD